jgi:hypothetical protein
LVTHHYRTAFTGYQPEMRLATQLPNVAATGRTGAYVLTAALTRSVILMKIRIHL